MVHEMFKVGEESQGYFKTCEGETFIVKQCNKIQKHVEKILNMSSHY
jgi:hypothetical protein